MASQDKTKLPFDEQGLERHIQKALAIKAPPSRWVEVSYGINQFLFQPELINTKNIPNKPCLFVGNHSLFALDAMVLLPLLQKELHRFVRSLGDRFLWSEKSEDLLLKAGGVLGDPSVCAALMKERCDLLVFPGGAHEALKPEREKYRLQWKQRYGFLRLAAEYGYSIVPMALVGPDEFYRHLCEGEDIANSALLQWLKGKGLVPASLNSDIYPPIPLGLMGTLLPKPQRCYFQFGEPLDMSVYSGKEMTKTQLQQARDRVAERIETMLAELLERRAEASHKDGLLRRLLTK